MPPRRPTPTTARIETIRTKWAKKHREEQRKVRREIDAWDAAPAPKAPKWYSGNGKKRTHLAHQHHLANRGNVHAAVDAWGHEITAQQGTLERIVRTHVRDPLESEIGNADEAIERKKQHAITVKHGHAKRYDQIKAGKA